MVTLQPCPASSDLEQALGAAPQQVLKARDYLCVFGSEDEVLALKPDITYLSATFGIKPIMPATMGPTPTPA